MCVGGVNIFTATYYTYVLVRVCVCVCACVCACACACVCVEPGESLKRELWLDLMSEVIALRLIVTHNALAHICGL